MNPGEFIRAATWIGAATLEKLVVGTRGEFVGAPTIPKDFEIVKAWIHFFLHQ